MAHLLQKRLYHVHLLLTEVLFLWRTKDLLIQLYEVLLKLLVACVLVYILLRHWVVVFVDLTYCSFFLLFA